MPAKEVEEEEGDVWGGWGGAVRAVSRGWGGTEGAGALGPDAVRHSNNGGIAHRAERCF